MIIKKELQRERDKKGEREKREKKISTTGIEECRIEGRGERDLGVGNVYW